MRTKTWFHPSPWHPVLISGLSKQCGLSKYLLRKLINEGILRKLSLSVQYFLRNFKKIKVLFGIVTALDRIHFRWTLTVQAIFGLYILSQEFKEERRDFNKILCHRGKKKSRQQNWVYVSCSQEFLLHCHQRYHSCTWEHSSPVRADAYGKTTNAQS